MSHFSKGTNSTALNQNTTNYFEALTLAKVTTGQDHPRIELAALNACFTLKGRAASIANDKVLIPHQKALFAAYKVTIKNPENKVEAYWKARNFRTLLMTQPNLIKKNIFTYFLSNQSTHCLLIFRPFIEKSLLKRTVVESIPHFIFAEQIAEAFIYRVRSAILDIENGYQGISEENFHKVMSKEAVYAQLANESNIGKTLKYAFYLADKLGYLPEATSKYTSNVAALLSFLLCRDVTYSNLVYYTITKKSWNWGMSRSHAVIQAQQYNVTYKMREKDFKEVISTIKNKEKRLDIQFGYEPSPEQWTHLKELESLNITYSGITSLPSEIMLLTALKRLNIWSLSQLQLSEDQIKWVKTLELNNCNTFVNERIRAQINNLNQN